jgi:hypothetical protein
MTTFTTNDREEAYKKILKDAPNQPGYEDAVPIPFAGWVNASPPVDSGASVMEVNAYELADQLEQGHWKSGTREKAAAMLRHQADYIKHLEEGLESSIKLNRAQAERQTKELTDAEIEEVWIQALQDEPKVNADKFPSLANQPFVFFARAILRKAQEK